MENWYHEYSGAAKMLEVLGLISKGECRSLAENLWCQLLAAKYPGIFQEEDA